ncbi:prepilin peptidase [Bacillus sp. HMF5848]|nr:prepilin peptidase [Bacillus sp. HMF5848]
MYLFVLLYSLLIASFLNVVGLRVPLGQSVVKPRSACPTCKRTLGALELIPVVSYVLQRGKCKNCGEVISPLYPIMELTTAILFTISPLLVGWSKELIVAWSLISLLMIITVSDIKYMIIPDKVLLFFLPLFSIERMFIPLTPWWDALAGAFVGFSLLYLIAFVTKGKGMGGGDIKLYGVLGIVLGTKLTIVSFFLAAFIGALVGGIGLALRLLQRNKPIPFGPFIVIGTLIAYFFGHELINIYLDLIGYY